MRIDKAQVLDILRSLGKDTSLAERELPDQVDTDDDAGLLGKFGISGGDLLEQFGGGAAGRDAGTAEEAKTPRDQILDEIPAAAAGVRGVGNFGAGR